MSWLLLLTIAAAPLALASTLTPSTTGLGTHTQLGLPPCGFLALFHLPCPVCGLTTALAYLAHGQLAHSLHAHPLGFAVGASLFALSARALIGSVRSDPFTAWLFAPARLYAALGFTLALGVTWFIRLAALL